MYPTKQVKTKSVNTTYLGGMFASRRPRWEGPSSTTGSFDPGDVLFIQENPFGDFSSATWEGLTLGSKFVDLHSWLNTSFMSSPEQCYVLEGFYERCLDKVRPSPPFLEERELRSNWPERSESFFTISLLLLSS